MLPDPSPPPPFDGLPAECFGSVALTRGQTLFRQGGAVSALYFVSSGKVSLQRHTEAGQTVTLHRAGPMDLIAEASLFSQAYHCDCIASADSTLISIRKASVLAALETEPAFGRALMARFARQVQGYRRQLELRTLRSARDRVLAGLSDGWLTGSVMQFASDLGLTHEATYRALARLARDGVVEKTGRGRYRMVPPL